MRLLPWDFIDIRRDEGSFWNADGSAAKDGCRDPELQRGAVPAAERATFGGGVCYESKN